MDRGQRGPFKTTEGQYSPVRLELARLVSNLLYGTRVMLVCFLLKRTSGHLNSKGFLRVFLMTRATQKEQGTTSFKTNSMNINHVEYK